MSPSRHTSTATWIIQLSPGGTETVTALPAACGAGIDRPHVGGEQALAALRLVDGGDAELGQRGDIGERRALEPLDDDPAHASTSGVSGKMR